MLPHRLAARFDGDPKPECVRATMGVNTVDEMSPVIPRPPPGNMIRSTQQQETFSCDVLFAAMRRI